MRRTLSQVVLKKRATAKAAERAVWAADDLLFIIELRWLGPRADQRIITAQSVAYPKK